MQKVVIVGAGGHGREVLDVFEALNEGTRRYEVLGYIVETGFGTPGELVNGRPILGDFDWLDGHTHEVEVICGVGAPELRRRLVQRAAAVGARFCSVVHPSVVRTRWIEVGAGVVIAPGCVLTNQIRIGNHVHVNVGCTIAHDGVLEDFATLAPGVRVCGNVTLEEGCYVGTGANIVERRRIGAWAVVGAGSTIVQDVPPNTTVVGVPGRVVRTREVGWQLK
jgi:sugar O-acyltransferase (sialic acid O-acetyltransferase NeuD family)